MILNYGGYVNICFQSYNIYILPFFCLSSWTPLCLKRCVWQKDGRQLFAQDPP